MSNFDFEPDTSVYSPKNALTLCTLSDLAYQDEAGVTSFLKTNGFTQIAYFDKEDTQAYVASRNDLIVVSFRGTESTGDWRTNRRIRRILAPGGKGKAHKGFLLGLEKVWLDHDSKLGIKNTLAEYRTRKQPVWFTGHSLGAALALLATAKYQYEEEQPVQGLYTYGCPRLCSRKFARRLNADLEKKMFRFANNNDIVPHIPSMSLGFRHAGTHVYIDSEGRFQVDKNFISRAIDRLEGLAKDALERGLDSIKDHGISLYKTHIQNNLDVLF